MRILELRWKNLNSLYGEWKIDFTNSEYTANSIFALTGPTGAGKSTILDAICLALYGRTPRLGLISSSENEIMSRQTGECYAEVLFESQKGRFRCRWRQNKKKKSANGKLQSPEHEISSADGAIIETKKNAVKQVIMEKTGLDFDRFTRSILLAQGRFDTFLRAKKEDKSKILEQITGSEIYSAISKRVHERNNSEKINLDHTRDDIADIETMDSEQEMEARRQHERIVKESSDIESKIESIDKEIELQNRIDDLQSEIDDITKQLAQVAHEIETMRPDREKLRLAQKANNLTKSYEQLDMTRKYQKSDQTKLTIANSDRAKLQIEEKQEKQRFADAKGLVEKARKEKETETKQIERVRALDLAIDKQRPLISSSHNACEKTRQEIKAAVEEMERKNAKRSKFEESLNNAKNHLKTHKLDKSLIAELGGITEKLNNLRDKQSERVRQENAIKTIKKTIDATSKKLREIETKYEIAEQNRTVAEANVQKNKAKLSATLKNKPIKYYIAQKEKLLREQSQSKTIHDFQESRAKLTDGSPCPLCGSTQHPYAKGNVPTPDTIDRKIDSLEKCIDKAEAIIEEIELLEKKADAAREKQKKLEHEKDLALAEQRSDEARDSESREQLEKLTDSLRKLEREIAAKLSPLGVEEIPTTQSEISSLLDSLKSRRDQWEQNNDRKTVAEQKTAEIDKEIARLNAFIDINQESLEKEVATLNQREEECAAEKKDRAQLYGDKNPDDEEARCERALKDAQKEEQTAEKRTNAKKSSPARRRPRTTCKILLIYGHWISNK